MGEIPEVAPGLHLFMQCFWDLAADRSERGKIPWMAVQTWGVAAGLDAELLSDLHFYINRLDMAYIEWAKEKQQALERERKLKEATRG